MGNRVHCYHFADSNRQRATFPHSEEYVCCFCGHTHTIRRVKPSGHGAYLPYGEGQMETLPKSEECPYVGKEVTHER
jgi:hypothetical protein